MLSGAVFWYRSRGYQRMNGTICRDGKVIFSLNSEVTK